MIVMVNVVNAIKELLGKFDYVHAIETGTIRSYDERHESTRHISKTLGNRGNLTSIDISEKSIKISKDICKNASNVEWVLSDSIEYLNKLPESAQFHFALLDSKNDERFIWTEFKAIAPHLVEDAILIVDDAGLKADGRVDKGIPAQKAHKVWRALSSRQCDAKVINSPHGTQLRVDFDRSNRKRVMRAIQ